MPTPRCSAACRQLMRALRFSTPTRSDSRRTARSTPRKARCTRARPCAFLKASTCPRRTRKRSGTATSRRSRAQSSRASRRDLSPFVPAQAGPPTTNSVRPRESGEGNALQHSVRPRESGDPERRIANFEVVGLDPRLRGDERSWCNHFALSWPGMTVEGIALQYSVRPREREVPPSVPSRESEVSPSVRPRGSGDPARETNLDSRLRGGERKLLQQLYSVMAGHDGGRHCTSTLRSSPRKRGARIPSFQLKRGVPVECPA